MAINRDRLGALTESASLRFSGTETVTFIDISDKPLKAPIVREGKQVPDVAFDPTRLADWIGGTVVVDRPLAPRVISQSIRPGTRVPRGTTVDLVLASRLNLPMDLLPEIHERFRDRTIDAVVTDFLQDPRVRDIVTRYDDPTTLAGEDRQFLQSFIQERNIPIVADDPRQNFDAAFRSLRGAEAFR
jgi:hypothetical protein